MRTISMQYVSLPKLNFSHQTVATAKTQPCHRIIFPTLENNIFLSNFFFLQECPSYGNTFLLYNCIQNLQWKPASIVVQGMQIKYKMKILLLLILYAETCFCFIFCSIPFTPTEILCFCCGFITQYNINIFALLYKKFCTKCKIESHFCI